LFPGAARNALTPDPAPEAPAVLDDPGTFDGRWNLADIYPDEAAFLQGLVDRALDPGNPGRGLDRLRLLTDLFDRARVYRLFAPVERPGRVLIIGARDDRGFSAAEREALIATYPGTMVRIFPRGGHWVGLAQRSANDAMIDEFLRVAPAAPR